MWNTEQNYRIGLRTLDKTILIISSVANGFITLHGDSDFSRSIMIRGSFTLADYTVTFYFFIDLFRIDYYVKHGLVKLLTFYSKIRDRPL